MRIAYLECFAGIAGDMLLGALIDAGVPAEVLEQATSALELGAWLKIETVDRSGISCTRVQVMEGAAVAEEVASHAAHGHAHGADHSHTHTHSHEDGSAHSHEDGHTHEDGHSHTHEHVHGRSLSVIRTLIRKAPLAEAVKARAIRTFELLGASEAKIHNVEVEAIHFHEVGAVDAIVDIVAACAGIEHLKVDAWHCSALNVGGGMVECAHGTFPVPAPATADLLRGFPTYSAHVQKELVTPTGAALVRMLEPVFGAQPAMSVERIGYGAGSRNPKGFPNALRISVGEVNGGAKTETVTVLETALDDLSPQVLAWVAERALAAGAMDVMLTPVIMKKGRPGTLLTVLCGEAKRPELERLILRETSTLGMRIRRDERSCLERHHLAVQTPYGEIRMKIGKLDGEVMNAAPEFEDCRAAAVRCDVPLKHVQQAAIAAYAAGEREKAGGKVAS
ncbi:MAG TPA: nickel pincer cofactor biosynthesis protein LarC [Acidobacteriaceae bacterium]|nr:nickel pincer cofactor biosynthesis protein LarC [Acidobacteriaceae bacterium]